jgi:hypothetical protein
MLSFCSGSFAEGFRAADPRRHLAALSGNDTASISQGTIIYQLRRLRKHGLIERVPKVSATASPTSACVSSCSSPEPTTACSARLRYNDRLRTLIAPEKCAAVFDARATRK